MSSTRIDEVLAAWGSVARSAERPAAASESTSVRRGPSTGIVVLAAVALALIAALSASRLAPAGRPGGPTSQVVGGLIPQLDGVYGYQALRPAGWTPVDLGDRRSYFAPGPETPDQGLVVSITNVEVSATGSDAGVGGALDAVTYWHLFEQDPSLASWTGAVEHEWARAGIDFTIVRRLSNATIYSLSVPNSEPLVTVVALKVTDGIPLEVDLGGGGVHANLANLEQQGVIDDLAVIIDSAQPLAVDPRNVRPPLPVAPSDAPGPAPSLDPGPP